MVTLKYLHPTYEAGKNLVLKNILGSIVNLNLIRLKEVADYSGFPEMAAAIAVSGYEAFMKYIELAKPFLEQGGGEILFIGKGDRYLIGPHDEQWDICMLIRQNSVKDFFAFEQNPDYMKITAHRSAAVLDSRLLPLEPYSEWQDHYERNRLIIP